MRFKVFQLRRQILARTLFSLRTPAPFRFTEDMTPEELVGDTLHQLGRMRFVQIAESLMGADK